MTFSCVFEYHDDIEVSKGLRSGLKTQDSIHLYRLNEGVQRTGTVALETHKKKIFFDWTVHLIIS